MQLINHPVLCNYYVTYKCNATCDFCDLWEKPSPYVNFKNVEENLIDLKKIGVKIIDFTGGEPLLHPDLHLFLQKAKDLGFMTTVTTNGVLYSKKAEKLKGLVDMLHFSLDAANADLHDKLRGTPCFSFVMNSIEKAKELGEQPDIIFTVMDENIDEIAEVYENISLPNNLVLILNPVFDYPGLKNRYTLSSNNLQKLIEWKNEKMIFLNESFVELRRDGGNHIDKPSCKAMSSTIVISPENKLIAPCYHLRLDEYPINGNLFELRNSKLISNKIQLEGRHEGCEGCVVNCYFQPSFTINFNKYFWKSMTSSLKYIAQKKLWKSVVG